VAPEADNNREKRLFEGWWLPNASSLFVNECAVEDGTCDESLTNQTALIGTQLITIRPV